MTTPQVQQEREKGVMELHKHCDRTAVDWLNRAARYLDSPESGEAHIKALIAEEVL